MAVTGTKWLELLTNLWFLDENVLKDWVLLPLDLPPFHVFFFSLSSSPISPSLITKKQKLTKLPFCHPGSTLSLPTHMQVPQVPHQEVLEEEEHPWLASRRGLWSIFVRAQVLQHQQRWWRRGRRRRRVNHSPLENFSGLFGHDLEFFFSFRS